MSMGFKRTFRGRITLTFDADERELLRGLLGQIAELVEPESPGGAAATSDEPDPLAAMVGIGTETRTPLDPALARLFPDAYNDDSIAAGDFRRYTELRLRRRKADAAATALETLERPSPVTLAEDDVAAWLGTLNDLRLVIGVRLGVQEDDDPFAWAEDPEVGSYLLYHWLTELQGALLEALG